MAATGHECATGCGRTDLTRDPNDGLFYCPDCWTAYSDPRLFADTTLLDTARAYRSDKVKALGDGLPGEGVPEIQHPEMAPEKKEESEFFKYMKAMTEAQERERKEFQHIIAEKLGDMTKVVKEPTESVMSGSMKSGTN